ncbi:alpha/beta fold hydrolase [Streptomyces thinghirensis]|uniref:Alpha/beta hydrolase n=1 Tax=Streptomyces thinghirensis TaxID=551547 RepID=A0ABP9T810_9ACTN
MTYTTTRDGTRIAYQLQGEGPALVLLAGQANSHHWWDSVRVDFHPVRTTLTLDYRGTGESDKPDILHSTELFAQDVIAVLDDLGIDRADIYGTSMGGRVAQHLAARHPHCVNALILGCTSPGGPHSIERGNDVRRALAQPQPAAARQACWNSRTHPAGSPTTPGHTTPSATPTRRPSPGVTTSRSATGTTPETSCPRISAPTLVLHGSDDLLNPTANAPLLADRIPDARVHLFPDTRHAYFEEARTHASPLVLDFLTATHQP